MKQKDRKGESLLEEPQMNVYAQRLTIGVDSKCRLGTELLRQTTVIYRDNIINLVFNIYVFN